MREFYRRNRNEISKVLFLIFLTLFIYVSVKYLLSYIAPFALGYIISMALIPLVNLLSKINIRVFGRKFYISRGISSFFALILFLAIIGSLGTTIVLRLIRQGREYAAFLPEIIRQIQEMFDSIIERYQHYTGLVPLELQIFIDGQIQALTDVVTSLVEAGVKQGSVGLVKVLPGFFVTLILGLVSAFFFTKDSSLIREHLNKISPDWFSSNMRIVRKGLMKTVSGYFRTQFTLASINASVCVVGLTIMQYPYALIVGLGISLLDVLPIFGAGAILWPWAAFSLITGNTPRAIGLMVIYAIILIIRQTLEPKFLGDNLGVYPLVTLAAMFIGLKMFGLFGFIIGPVLIIIAKAIWETPLEQNDDFQGGE